MGPEGGRLTNTNTELAVRRRCSLKVTMHQGALQQHRRQRSCEQATYMGRSSKRSWRCLLDRRLGMAICRLLQKKRIASAGAALVTWRYMPLLCIRFPCGGLVAESQQKRTVQARPALLAATPGRPNNVHGSASATHPGLDV